MLPRTEHVMAKSEKCADRVVASPAECRNAILEAIRGATREISLSIFRCNDPEVFQELRRARARGVAVNALVTARADGSSKKLEKLRGLLLDVGASVATYADPVVKYHAKYLVVDDGPAIVASLNFTPKRSAPSLKRIKLSAPESKQSRAVLPLILASSQILSSSESARAVKQRILTTKKASRFLGIMSIELHPCATRDKGNWQRRVFDRL